MRNSAGTLLLPLLLLGACGDSPYEPVPEALIGDFSGTAGSGFETYNLLVRVEEIGDSVRGLWSLSFQASCATQDGPFSGVLEGNRLRLRLRPDEATEATLDLNVRVLPGDSVLTGPLTLLASGDVGTGPALCGSDQLAPVTLHSVAAGGLPLGPPDPVKAAAGFAVLHC